MNLLLHSLLTDGLYPKSCNMPNIIKKVLANVFQPLTIAEMAIAMGNIGAASADSTPCHLLLSNGIGLHDAQQSVGTTWTKVRTCTFGSSRTPSEPRQFAFIWRTSKLNVIATKLDFYG